MDMTLEPQAKTLVIDEVHRPSSAVVSLYISMKLTQYTSELQCE